MLRTTLMLAATIAAAGFVVASRALPVQQLLVVSSDANARFLELGFNKAVAIDLPRDVKGSAGRGYKNGQCRRANDATGLHRRGGPG
jgi:N-acetylglutamate synthase-like GNAT family acetyltransferase